MALQSTLDEAPPRYARCMTTVASAVEWIRFDTPLGESVGSDSGELWQLDLNIEREEFGDFETPLRPRIFATPSMLATLGLVLTRRESSFHAEAEIRRLHAFLSPLQYFGIEAAVTVPGSPYNRVELPRVSATDFAVSQKVTADGKTALIFLTATVHQVEVGRYVKLRHAA